MRQICSKLSLGPVRLPLSHCDYMYGDFDDAGAVEGSRRLGVERRDRDEAAEGTCRRQKTDE